MRIRLVSASFLCLLLFGILAAAPAWANFYAIPVGVQKIQPEDVVELHGHLFPTDVQLHPLYEVDPEGNSDSSTAYTVPNGKMLIITDVTLSTEYDSNASHVAYLYHAPEGGFRANWRFVASETKTFYITPGLRIASGETLSLMGKNGNAVSFDVYMFGYLIDE